MAQIQAKPSITSHGLFPAIVAVWFATLFGLGCLVLPSVLLERAADASRIAALVPAAAPPLGLTAHILLSCAAGVFGALLGFAIARRVAAAQNGPRPAKAERPPRARQPKLESRRPILTMEELGEAPIAPPAPPEPQAEAEAEEPAPLPGRRRRLALDEELAPSVPQAEPFPWADEHPLMPSAQALTEMAMALPTVPEPQPEPFAAHAAPVAHDFAPESPLEPPFEAALTPAFEPVLPPAPVIDAEPADAILSDDRIVEILRGEGIDIARRTVAKYREGMRIPSSVQRRREKGLSR